MVAALVLVVASFVVVLVPFTLAVEVESSCVSVVISVGMDLVEVVDASVVVVTCTEEAVAVEEKEDGESEAIQVASGMGDAKK